MELGYAEPEKLELHGNRKWKGLEVRKPEHTPAVCDKEGKETHRRMGGLRRWGPASIGQDGSKVC